MRDSTLKSIPPSKSLQGALHIDYLPDAINYWYFYYYLALFFNFPTLRIQWRGRVRKNKNFQQVLFYLRPQIGTIAIRHTYYISTYWYMGGIQVAVWILLLTEKMKRFLLLRGAGCHKTLALKRVFPSKIFFYCIIPFSEEKQQAKLYDHLWHQHLDMRPCNQVLFSNYISVLSLHWFLR